MVAESVRRKRKRDITLPLLPVPSHMGVTGCMVLAYTEQQMKDYATQAVAEDRELSFSRKSKSHLQEGSRSFVIMREFESGPKTTGDMCRLLEGLEDSRLMSVYLTNLYKRGYLTREEVIVPSQNGVQRRQWLWSAVKLPNVASVKW